MSEEDLLASLNEGELTNTMVRSKVCQVCATIARVENAQVKVVLTRAAGGTIGREKLTAIMRANGYNVGRRHIERHRQEGHTP